MYLPTMKVVVMAIGSRGDVEPLLAIGEQYRTAGNEVVYIFPEQFRSIVEELGCPFYGFTSEFIDVLIKGEEGAQIMGRSGNWLQRFRNILKIIPKSKEINRKILEKEYEVLDTERPDLVVFHQKNLMPVVWSMKHPVKAQMVLPIPCMQHPVPDHSVIGFSGGGNYGKWINRMSYSLKNSVLSLAIYFTTKAYRKRLGIRPSISGIKKHFLYDVDSLYTVSNELFQRPSSWPENAKVIGFQERDKTLSWSPSEDLKAFLDTHDKVLFISFGSMKNPRPSEVTEIILSSLKELGIPAIINTSWGGVERIDGLDQDVLYVQDIPYDWILPRVYGIIHHGGAGTTHNGVKAGCASLIIPHFIDQYYWNRVVSDKGLGPKGVPIRSLSKESFFPLLKDLWTNKSYKTRAKEVGQKIVNEGSRLEI